MSCLLRRTQASSTHRSEQALHLVQVVPVLAQALGVDRETLLPNELSELAQIHSFLKDLSPSCSSRKHWTALSA